MIKYLSWFSSELCTVQRWLCLLLYTMFLFSSWIHQQICCWKLWQWRNSHFCSNVYLLFMGKCFYVTDHFTKSRWAAKFYLFNYQTQYLNCYDEFHSLIIDLDHFRHLVYISFQIKSVKTGSMSWAIFTALSYFYMVSIWINILVSSLLFRYFLLVIERKNCYLTRWY